MQKKKRNAVIFYAVMAAPILLQFLLFYVYVNFNSVSLAFKTWDPATESYRFTWFSNIAQVARDIFTEPVLRTSFLNSLIVFAVTLVISTPLGLLFSYYIYKKKPGYRVFRIFLFLPSIISGIVMAILFSYMADAVIPTIVEKWFHVSIQGLLENPKLTFPVLLLYSIWIGFGSSTLLYVGTMGDISDSVIEAAQIDGAGFFREFFSVVLPSVFPTFVTFTMMSVAGIFSTQLALFDFYGKGAQVRLYTVGYYLYLNTLDAGMGQYPYLAALGVMLTAVMAPLAFGVKKLLTRFGPSADR